MSWCPRSAFLSGTKDRGRATYSRDSNAVGAALSRIRHGIGYLLPMALWDRRCVSFPQLGETEKQATCRQQKTTVTAKQTQRWLSCGVTKTGLSWIEDAEVGCHKAGTSSFRSGPSHILPSPSRERAALRAVGEFGEACSDDRRSSEKKEETKKTLIGAPFAVYMTKVALCERAAWRGGSR